MKRGYRVDPVPTAAGAARRFVTTAAADWGLSDEMREIAHLVVSELVSNAVEHAKSAATIHLELDGEGLTISVGDRSPLQPTPRALDSASFRGRGLALVARLSQRWGVRFDPNGKTVWALLAPA